MPSLALKSVLFGFLTFISANYLQTHQHLYSTVFPSLYGNYCTVGVFDHPGIIQQYKYVEKYLWHSVIPS